MVPFWRAGYANELWKCGIREPQSLPNSLSVVMPATWSRRFSLRVCAPKTDVRRTDPPPGLGPALASSICKKCTALLTARDCSSWTSEMKPAAPHNTRQWNPAMHK
jgi:hypothetical protein